MNSYDAIRYPTAPKDQSHPDRLASVAMMYGLSPAPVGRCRVLELGASDGNNIIPMAYGLPDSEFTGIDMAAAPVAEGQARIAALGLRNVRLLAMDIMDLAPSFGEFDYIVAHGIYSWVPTAVRDRILAVCRANLAPGGIAYVSYNAYPGCHLRRMVREMMLYHIAAIADPVERIQQACSLASLMAEAQPEEGLRREFEVVLERTPSVIYHDDIADVNHPVYFHQFAAHAREHGLQFLAEATLVAADAHLPESVRKILKPLESDPIRREQYLDFAKLRRFRQTLLCHQEATVLRPVCHERVRALYASSMAQPGPEEPGGAVEFRGEKGAAAKTVHPLAKAALTVLGRAWPRRLAFPALLAEARHASAGAATAEQDASALSEILWHTCQAGLVELHAHPGCFAAAPGPRPVASAVARLDLRTGAITATLAHGVVEVEDAVSRRLVEMLDGTRDRATLAVELDVPLAALEATLTRLARLPLLIA